MYDIEKEAAARAYDDQAILKQTNKQTHLQTQLSTTKQQTKFKSKRRTKTRIPNNSTIYGYMRWYKRINQV
jgi:hypothetical protein